MFLRAVALGAWLWLSALPANADGACGDAFSRWVKNSEATYQSQPKAAAKPGENAREACLPNEAARKSLQRSLASVRRHCEAPDAGADAEATKPLVEINADVLATTPICGGGSRLAASPSEADGNSCLSLNQAGSVYYLANTRCTGSKVIAVVEIKLSSGAIKCRGHVIASQTKLGTTKPNINYECVENGSDCSTKSVKGIFPYCSW